MASNVLFPDQGGWKFWAGCGSSQPRLQAPGSGGPSWPAAAAALSGGPSAAASEGHYLSPATAATGAAALRGRTSLLA